MYSEKFKQLHQLYMQKRSIDLTEDQFAALVYTFPSILTANADGKLDHEEKEFMRLLPQVLVSEEIKEEERVNVTLTDEYFKEAIFIIKNIGDWEEEFLEALKEQLHNSRNERNAIFRSMWRTADSSNDISELERKTILTVTERLGL